MPTNGYLTKFLQEPSKAKRNNDIFCPTADAEIKDWKFAAKFQNLTSNEVTLPVKKVLMPIVTKLYEGAKTHHVFTNNSSIKILPYYIWSNGSEYMDATADFKKYADLKNQFVYNSLKHNTYYYLNNKVVATTSSAETEDFYSLSLFRPENVDSTKTQYESVTTKPVGGAKLDYVPGRREANDKFYYFTQYESYFNASGNKISLESKKVL
ncbi:hypothetical protein ACWNT8_06730 [Pigmentibacter ruber]